MMAEIATPENSSARFFELYKLQALLRKAIDDIYDIKSEKYNALVLCTSSTIMQPLRCLYGISYVDYNASFAGNVTESVHS